MTSTELSNLKQDLNDAYVSNSGFLIPNDTIKDFIDFIEKYEDNLSEIEDLRDDLDALEQEQEEIWIDVNEADSIIEHIAIKSDDAYNKIYKLYNSLNDDDKKRFKVLKEACNEIIKICDLAADLTSTINN